MDGSYLNKANLALAPLEFGNYTITIYHEVKCNNRRKNPAKRRYVRPVSVFIKILVGGKGEGKSAKKQM